jgi:hypothetical protein
MGALMRVMPAFEAGVSERAAWLELKAEVFTQLAAEHRAVAAEAGAYARMAPEQAAALRGSDVPPTVVIPGCDQALSPAQVRALTAPAALPYSLRYR